jgi:beta-lactamase class D
MKQVFTAFLLLFVTLSSSRSGEARARWASAPQWNTHFQKAGVNGSFLLFDLNRGHYTAWNRQRAQTRFLPGSTFKVLHSLIALDVGTVRDENEILPWDGLDRGLADWNRDHDMKSAFSASAIWFYQAMASRIGVERMTKNLRAARYGNADIGGGLDRFWLGGDLRISSEEQVQFLVKLYRNRLPFSPRAMTIVKNIMEQERDNGWVLRAKSGWVGFNPDGQLPAVKPQIGWIVGWVERGTDAYFFALNIEIKRAEDAAARKAITYAILREMRVLD